MGNLTSRAIKRNKIPLSHSRRMSGHPESQSDHACPALPNGPERGQLAAAAFARQKCVCVCLFAMLLPVVGPSRDRNHFLRQTFPAWATTKHTHTQRAHEAFPPQWRFGLVVCVEWRENRKILIRRAQYIMGSGDPSIREPGRGPSMQQVNFLCTPFWIPLGYLHFLPPRTPPQLFSAIALFYTQTKNG